MPRARILTVAAVAALIAACSDTSLPASPEGYAHAYATRDCGPADGPAVRIFLVGQEPAVWPPTGARIELAVWRSVGELPGIALEWSGQSGEGWAGRCDETGQCEAATSARVRFLALTADSTLTGTIALAFADGARTAGGFAAAWHPATPICG